MEDEKRQNGEQTVEEILAELAQKRDEAQTVETVETADTVGAALDMAMPDTQDTAKETAEPAPQTPEEPDASAPDAPAQKGLAWVLDLLDTFAVALAIMTVIFTFFFRMVEVDGGSMNDTLTDHDRLVLQTAAYTPVRGDIVVLYQETEPQKPLIKRVIGIAGDSVRLNPQTNEVFLKKAGEEEFLRLEEDYVHYDLGWGIMWDDDGDNTITVPAGEVFVLGDHRNNSNDSRYLGTFPVEDVVGHAVWRIYPFADFGGV